MSYHDFTDPVLLERVRHEVMGMEIGRIKALRDHARDCRRVGIVAAGSLRKALMRYARREWEHVATERELEQTVLQALAGLR